MPSDRILRTIDLGKRYGHRWAVQRLNLEVFRGQVFGFLGPNGAGKSTTIRMMLSLIRPSAGHVELFGKRLDKDRQAILSRVGGLVESADFYSYLTARRNLAIVGALYGKVDRDAIERALHLVGLADRGDDRVKTYSHGMKQRLGIAQALLIDPELIILDEPTTGLDPQGIAEVRDLINSLSRDQGITIFLSSHLLSEIEQTASTMAIINHGSLVVQGSVRELLAADAATVRIDARPIDVALRVLGETRPVADPRIDNGLITISVAHEIVPGLVKSLVEKGVAIHSVVPQRSLEEYFLKITAESERGTAPSSSPGSPA
ncbi:MAG: ABC transporter ATP-binding protein [Bacteroidota bacterium]